MSVIIVKGRPVSVNASSRRKTKWKDNVAREATKVYTTPLNGDNLSIKITFFYSVRPDFDTDNICKPICDALNGIVYHDDIQLAERHAYNRDINGPYTLEGVEPRTVDALTRKNEFVCIKIETANLGVLDA